MSFWKSVTNAASFIFPVQSFATNYLTDVVKNKQVNPVPSAFKTANDASSFVSGKPLIPPPSAPDMPGPASTPGDAGPTPTPIAPNPTESAAQQAKRRAALLRMGLLSTITTSGQGVTAAPNLFQPAASASGMKTQLGQ